MTLIQEIERWKFIRGFGRLSHQYAKLVQAQDKAVMLQKTFGKHWIDVLHEKEYWDEIH